MQFQMREELPGPVELIRTGGFVQSALRPQAHIQEIVGICLRVGLSCKLLGKPPLGEE